MSINEKSIEELVKIASTTVCTTEMNYLQKYPAMNVRRALARNVNIDFNILTKLQKDPVENVSYIANQNPRSNEKREFKNIRPCVSCDKEYDQLKNYCNTCEMVKEHRF